MNSAFHWARLALKNGVRIGPGHLYPCIHKMFDATLITAPETTDGLVIVTSLNDGRHKRDSKHYDDEAIDWRLWNILVDGEDASIDWDARPTSRSIAKSWVSEIQARLGEDYEVILEEHLVWVESLSRRVLVPHIHEEWDPIQGGNDG